jgi:hypothetical protein
MISKSFSTILVAAVLFVPVRASASSVIDFPEAVINLDDVPEEIYSGVLVVISGGYSPFVEKRWFVWADGEGDFYKLEATLAVGGEIEVFARSEEPVSYAEFETALLEFGILELTDPEPTGTGALYVTDLPTYHVYFKNGEGRNSFSVRNPAAAGDERYSGIIEAILDYFQGE